MGKARKLNFNTKVVKAGRSSADYQGVVNTPVFRTSTVLFSDLAKLQDSERKPFDTMHYGRFSNPTVRAFEDAVTELEGGYRGIAGSSGLAIITTVLLAYADTGKHFLIPENVYGGVRRFCAEVFAKLGIRVEFYAPAQSLSLAEKIRSNTALIYVESPGSTDFRLTDLPAIIRIAKSADIPVVVDNTWATPLYYKPLHLGADISLHSASKYIVGHSDSLLGIAACTRKSWPVVNRMSFLLGSHVSPDDAYLALRGLRTLPLRMARHQESALKIANWLKKQRAVEQVYYPAIPTDPNYALWKRDYSGASGRFAIKLRKASVRSVKLMLDNLKHFGIGFGWGGYESLIVPEGLDPNSKRAQHVTLRLSIGLEDSDELIEDLRSGLRRLRLI